MFKPGNVVRLIGTKMEMVVDSILADYATVMWFDREDELNKYTFHLDRLEFVRT